LAQKFKRLPHGYHIGKTQKAAARQPRDSHEYNQSKVTPNYDALLTKHQKNNLKNQQFFF
jgi:hypothetical protein